MFVLNSFILQCESGLCIRFDETVCKALYNLPLIQPFTQIHAHMTASHHTRHTCLTIRTNLGFNVLLMDNLHYLQLRLIK